MQPSSPIGGILPRPISEDSAHHLVEKNWKMFCLLSTMEFTRRINILNDDLDHTYISPDAAETLINWHKESQ